MSRLEVKTSKLLFIAVILLVIILVPLIVVSVINGASDGLDILSLGLGIMMLITFVGVLLLVRRGYTNSVKYFSDEGLTRNDGDE